MITLTIDQVVKKVRAKYDEMELNESEMINNEDDSNLSAVIKDSISDAYRFVMMSADPSMLEGKQHINGVLTIDDNLVGRVDIPNDFLRGITVRLSSWQSSPSEIITDDTPQYRMQSDPYACGTHQEPVAALVHTATGRMMEFYKAKSKQDTITSFAYVPTWNDSSESIEIPNQLTNAFIYYTAGLTATTFREDVANDLFKVARGLLGIE